MSMQRKIIRRRKKLEQDGKLELMFFKASLARQEKKRKKQRELAEVETLLESIEKIK